MGKAAVRTFLLTAMAAGMMISLSGCGIFGHKLDGDGMVRTPFYAQISQDEAKLMMKEDDGHVIVDVRRADEYARAHIPGAVLIPNEEIGTEPPKELPDKYQIILVYCRTGRRSKEAAQKLADMGYVNVYEFGGIVDWTGELIKEEADSEAVEDPASDGQEEADTEMTLRINGEEYPVEWEDNGSVEALKELCPLTVEMSGYGGFEQVGFLGSDLPREDEEITTDPGDIVLYSGDQIVVFYGSNSWAYTRLGHILADRERLEAALGGGDVTLELR